MKTIAITPINRDVNASKRDYETLQKGQLLVYSSFFTFQGEGPYMGTPALFVRLAGCNIGAKQDCPWCDTKFELDKGRVVNGHDMVMASLAVNKFDLIVVTGGEPLLQWSRLREVIASVEPHFGTLSRPTWQLETNGLLLREEMLQCADKHGNVYFVVSPKVPHSRVTYPELPPFLDRYGHLLSLKYVVEDNPDSPYYDIPEDAIGAVPEVYISGMTVYKRSPIFGEVASVWDQTMIDHEATARNYKHAARLALNYGRKVSYQTHLFGGME